MMYGGSFHAYECTRGRYWNLQSCSITNNYGNSHAFPPHYQTGGTIDQTACRAYFYQNGIRMNDIVVSTTLC